MTCGDHSDPEVGSWVMDNPQVPWRPLLKSLRQDCESIQTMWKHSNQPVKLKHGTEKPSLPDPVCKDKGEEGRKTTSQIEAKNPSSQVQD